MARPSLADSLKASLSKGVHVDTAERIKQGLPTVVDGPPILPISEPPLIATDIPVASATASSIGPVLSSSDATSIKPSNATSDELLDATSGATSYISPNETSYAAPDATSVVTFDVASNGTVDAAYNVLANDTSDESTRFEDRQTSRATTRDTNITEIRSSSHNTSHTEQCHTERQTERITDRHTLRLTERATYHHDPIMTLTVRQGMCLYYLLQRPDYIAQRHSMGEALNLPLPTIRDCITVLVRERFISKPQKIVIRSFQGFTYRLVDEDQCARFMHLRGEEFANAIERNTGRNTSRLLGRNTMRQTNAAINVLSHETSDEFPSFSSSRNEFKTTTTENRPSDDLLKDPELGYWKEKGVNNRQINSWSEEFQMPIDQVLQSLRYCRFDMVVLNQEEEKQISNPMNWFYKVMQRSGLYPKPTGYKSLAEIRAEQMEQAARDAAEARERQVAAEHELAFQKLMSNPDSEEYRRLLANVDEFAKDVGGKVLETALREAFRAGAV